MAKLIALTSHPVVILDPETPVKETEVRGRKSLVFTGDYIAPYVMATIEPSGLPVPAVKQESDGNGEPETFTIEFDGASVTVCREPQGRAVIVDLPEPQNDVYYIASSFTADAACRLGRTDVIAPAQLVLAEREDGSTMILGTIGFK